MHFIWVLFSLFTIVKPCKYDISDPTLKKYDPLNHCNTNCVVKYDIPRILEAEDKIIISVKYADGTDNKGSMCVSLRKELEIKKESKPTYAFKWILKNDTMINIRNLDIANVKAQKHYKGNQKYTAGLKVKTITIRFFLSDDNKEFGKIKVGEKEETIEIELQHLSDANQIIINGDITNVETVEITKDDDDDHAERPLVVIKTKEYL